MNREQAYFKNHLTAFLHLYKRKHSTVRVNEKRTRSYLDKWLGSDINVQSDIKTPASIVSFPVFSERWNSGISWSLHMTSAESFANRPILIDMATVQIDDVSDATSFVGNIKVSVIFMELVFLFLTMHVIGGDCDRRTDGDR